LYNFSRHQSRRPVVERLNLEEDFMEVKGFLHRPGIHCGSSAMRNIITFLGKEIQEETIFGLGEGVSFIYVPRQEVPPYIAIHGRSLDLEEILARRLGLDYVEQIDDDGDRSWKKCKKMIDGGLPVLINTDIRHLEYFGSTTHFSGHRVVLAGYNDEGVLLSDSEFPEIMEISIDGLKSARESKIPPFPMGNCMAVVTGTPLLPGEEGFVDSIVSCSRKMIFSRNPMMGLSGMIKASQEMPSWYTRSQTPDFVARFAYQVIEKRGTGGGFFRNIYKKFLVLASRTIPSLDRGGFIEEMGGLAYEWSAFADFLKNLSENCSREGFVKGQKIFDRIVSREEGYHSRVLKFFT